MANAFDPQGAVTGNGTESHYDLALQLENLGYTVDADHEDNEHSYVRHESTGDTILADIHGDSEATVTNTEATELALVKQMGWDDAIQACQESGSTKTPDGGWDSWLINGIGSDATCQLLGECPEANEGGWTEAMEAKLIAYHQGAEAAAAELEAAE